MTQLVDDLKAARARFALNPYPDGSITDAISEAPSHSRWEAIRYAIFEHVPNGDLRSFTNEAAFKCFDAAIAAATPQEGSGNE